MSPETHVLTLMEVATLLRVPKSTVYKLAQNGTVPAFKVGKHWRFLLGDIEAWLRSQGNGPVVTGGESASVRRLGPGLALGQPPDPELPARDAQVLADK